MGHRGRLLSRDFFLLCQGQIVSSVGDAVHRVALGFWMLAATGSTAQMGAVMAGSLLPRVVLGPWAGAAADRFSRRAILVSCDVAAGLAVTLLGVAALSHELSVWMVVAASVLVGVAGAFFDPTIAAAVPDLVPTSVLGRANGALSLGYTGATVVGSALGGIGYRALGAPLLFLGNGLSYLYSAASELAVRFPAGRQSRPQRPLTRDLAAGLGLVWRDRGLRGLLAATGVAHVGTSAVLVALVPHCQRHPALGAAGFGLLMAGLSFGAFAGFALTSALESPARSRPALFLLAAGAQAAAFGAMPWLEGLVPVVVLAAVSGLAMSVESTVLTTAFQLAVPATMRGKLFGLRATWLTGLGMLSTAGAGLLSDAWSVPMLISSCAALVLAAALGTALVRPAWRALGA